MADTLADIFTLGLLVPLFLITIVSQVSFLINVYQVQSVLVVGIAISAALATQPGLGPNPLVDGAIALLPLLVIGLIRPALVRATLPAPDLRPAPAPWWRRRPFGVSPDWARLAEQEWLRRQGANARRSFFAPLLFIVILTGAFFIATIIVQPPHFADGAPNSLRIGLTLTITLVLIGLFNMVIKRDLIAQVLGLLVMDHGLFLAVLRIVPTHAPGAVTPFVVSLYFYTLLTVFILVLVLPQLRRVTGTIDLSQIERDSELKG